MEEELGYTNEVKFNAGLATIEAICNLRTKMYQATFEAALTGDAFYMGQVQYAQINLMKAILSTCSPLLKSDDDVKHFKDRIIKIKITCKMDSLGNSKPYYSEIVENTMNDIIMDLQRKLQEDTKCFVPKKREAMF